jgi:hypothetical protein
MLPFLNAPSLELDTYTINAPSGSSVVFNIPKIYKQLILVSTGAGTSMANVAQRRFELSDDGAATWGSVQVFKGSIGSISANLIGAIKIMNVGKISAKPWISSFSFGALPSCSFGEETTKTGLINAIRITTSSGNFAGEIYRLWGLK